MTDFARRLSGNGSGTASLSHNASLIPVVAFGMALSLLFAIAYVLCVVFYLISPDVASGHAILMLLLPGFKLLSLVSFLLGLVESFAYGWFVALVFAPLYNFFLARWH